MKMTVGEIERHIIKAKELETKLTDRSNYYEKEDVTLNKREISDLMDILDNYCCILKELKVEI